jgi:hypothetical protein
MDVAPFDHLAYSLSISLGVCGTLLGKAFFHRFKIKTGTWLHGRKKARRIATTHQKDAACK